MSLSLSEPGKPLEIGFLVVDGFSMMCFANAVEPLRAANITLGERLFQRRIITPDGRPVSSSSNFSLLADCSPLDDFSLDWLFVIAPYTTTCLGIFEPLFAMCIQRKKDK